MTKIQSFATNKEFQYAAVNSYVRRPPTIAESSAQTIKNNDATTLRINESKYYYYHPSRSVASHGSAVMPEFTTDSSRKMLELASSDEETTSANNELERQQTASDPATAHSSNDGGFSVSKMTDGEVALVAFLSFVVILVIAFSIYAVTRRRRNLRQIQQKEAALPEQDPEEMPICVIEMDERPLDRQSSQLVNNSLHGSSQHGSDGGPIGDNSWHSRGSRRGSIGSNAGNRRASIDSTSSGYRRRDSMNSMGSNVSKQYKFAAIDHMNQISQAGKH